MWSLPLEVTITNMIVSNKKVNKTKIKLKSLVTGFFLSFFLRLFLQSGERKREKKKQSIHNESEWKKKKKNNTFTCCKNTFPNFNITHRHFQNIHSFLVRWLDVSAKNETEKQKSRGGAKKKKRRLF